MKRVINSVDNLLIERKDGVIPARPYPKSPQLQLHISTPFFDIVPDHAI